MAYNPLKLGSASQSKEAVETSLRKIDEMFAELYSANSTLTNWAEFDYSIVPRTATQDLGSAQNPWRRLYVSSNTIYLGSTPLSVDQSGQLQVGTANYATVDYVDNAISNVEVDLTGYATETYVNTSISNLINSAPTALNTLNELAAALGNDANFASSITNALSQKANSSSLAPVAFSGSYNSLPDRPSLAPVATSNNYSDLSNRPSFATVAFSGSYGDLINRPNLSTVATSGSYNDLSNRPNLATVATSGSYADLLNTPTINTLVPSQSTNGGKFLTTNGSTVSWSTVNISALAGVSISGPQPGQVLKYNGVSWYNGPDEGTGGGGASSRSTAAGTTSSLANDATENITITGYKGYALYKIQTSAAAWIRVYTSQAARTADSTRDIITDPEPGAGVIAEIISTGAQTINLAPGIIGFNDEATPTTDIYLAVTNKAGTTTAITVTLTLLQLEV